MAKHTCILELFYDAAWVVVPVYTRDAITVMRGAKDPGSDTEAAYAVLTIDNHSLLYSPRSASSLLFGKIGQNTPARVTIDGSIRLVGQVSEWRPGRPVKGGGWVRIKISGVLQQIGRGSDPIHSAATRAALALGPVALWPLESFGNSLVPGVGPMVQQSTPLTWADSTAIPGLQAIPSVSVADGTSVISVKALRGVAPGVSATAWTVGCWIVGTPYDATDVAGEVLAWFGTPGGTAFPNQQWTMNVHNGPSWGGDTVDTGFNVGGGSAAASGTLVLDGAPHLLLCVAEVTAPSTIRITLYVDGVATVGVPATPYTLRPVDVVLAGWSAGAASGPDPNLWTGGVMVLDRAITAGEAATLYQAGLAFVGETAAARFTRFCGEEGITPTVVGTAADTLGMGLQVPQTLLDEFDEVARTDDASIFETRSAAGLTMRTGPSKQNQAPDLTLNYIGDITTDLEAVIGDTWLRNDVTARSPAGDERRFTEDRGAYAVATVGRYQTSIDANPSTSAGLSDAAGWRVHLGTFDGTWYAQITADCDASPGVAAVAASLDIGDCLALASLPVDEALDTVESVIIGIGETVLNGGFRRLITFYCVSADPYRTGLLALASGDTDPFLGHLDSDGSTTSGATAAGAATFSVATASGPLWTVDADDFPFDVVVGGQRVSLASISGAASPQTFTVRAASLGGRQIRYPIPAGSKVEPHQPLVLVL